jgi:hypothetical protein
MVAKSYPVILVDTNGKLFNGSADNNQTDCRIIHPVSTYIQERPDWLSLYGKRKAFTISPSKITSYPALILAYRDQEFEKNGAPADVIEILNEESIPALWLSDGRYTIVIKDKNYTISHQFVKRIR